MENNDQSTNMPSKNKKGKSKNAAVAVQQDAVGMEKPSNRKRKNGAADAAVQQAAVQQEVDTPSVGIEGIEEASETQGGARKRNKTTTIASPRQIKRRLLSSS